MISASSNVALENELRYNSGQTNHKNDAMESIREDYARNMLENEYDFTLTDDLFAEHTTMRTFLKNANVAFRLGFMVLLKSYY